MPTTKLSFPREKIKVLLLENIHSSALKALHDKGYASVEHYPHVLSEDELLKVISRVHMIGIRSGTHLTAPVFAAAKKLLAVGCFCIGTNQVDLMAAKKTGVPVFNAPFSNTRSVAELVIGHIIYLMRGIAEKNVATHRGAWRKSAVGSHEVRGRTLGIVGYGRIGKQVGILAESLGMKVCYYDPIKQLNLGNARPIASLKDLLAQSDIVTLHVPGVPGTKKLIGEAQVKHMKRGAKLINTSRGNVVDIEAIVNALQAKHLTGAAFDVYPSEPASRRERFESELQEFDNVILTPHIGGSTMEAQESIGREVANKLITYSDNGSTAMSVNFPEVDLPPQQGKRRMLHIHHNVPGVLSAVNTIIANSGGSIAAQYLQTDAEIGYVVIDIDTPVKQLNVAALKAIPGTIKTRVLY